MELPFGRPIWQLQGVQLLKTLELHEIMKFGGVPFLASTGFKKQLRKGTPIRLPLGPVCWRVPCKSLLDSRFTKVFEDGSENHLIQLSANELLNHTGRNTLCTGAEAKTSNRSSANYSQRTPL